MLDQTFSAENFRKIFDIENRKGNNIEDKDFFSDSSLFEASRRHSRRIIEINSQLRELTSDISSNNLNNEQLYDQILQLKEEKEQIGNLRNEEIRSSLNKISLEVNKEDFKIELIAGRLIAGKKTYMIKKTAGNFFAEKQVQQNIHKTFKVKQSNRNHILSQLVLLLDDSFPKVVVRTDLKGFYESIPHKFLVSKIDNNSLLEISSKKVIKSLLHQYWKMQVDEGSVSESEERHGIPRGVGISSYLSELYLKDFDKQVSSLKLVTSYYRYVDDIFIVFTPESRRNNSSNKVYKNIVLDKIKLFGVTANTNKTKVFNLLKSGKERKIGRSYVLTYLGYKLTLTYKLNRHNNSIEKNKLVVSMSDAKLEKYRNKIALSFESYHADIAKYTGNSSAVERKLVQRLKYLATNFQLIHRKSNVLVGIFYSNRFLNGELQDLDYLDGIMRDQIGKLSQYTSNRLIERLQDISFRSGFTEKRMTAFCFNKTRHRGAINSDKLTKIWKDL